MPVLTEQAVDELIVRCAWNFTDAPEDQVAIKGIGERVFRFDRRRIAENAHAIAELLAELPREFLSPNGWPFMHAARDRRGRRWTELEAAEDLFCLGIAAGMARWAHSREHWEGLPGHLPYVSLAPEAKAP